MINKREIANNKIEKMNKFQFFLFIFILLFIVIKFDKNSTLNELRKEKNELNEIFINSNSLNRDYLNICNLNVNEKQKVATLNSYFKYLTYNHLTENEEILHNIIAFFQYVLNKDEKNKTLICPNESNIKIKELLTFSNYLKAYRDFTNSIQQSHKSLFEEIKDTTNLNNFKYFTLEEKQRILGGEDIFVAITGRFGENLQKTNKLEDDFEKELSNQAKKLFYSDDDFSELTLTQLKKLIENYDKYIDKVLENVMTEKNTIPFTELSFDRTIFSIIILIAINLLLFILILEKIKVNKIVDKIELEECISSYYVFCFLWKNKNTKSRYSNYERLLICFWSFLFLSLPIIALIYFINNFNFILLSFETFLAALFILLYYLWSHIIYKSLKT